MNKNLISKINEIISEYHGFHKAPNRDEENAPLYDVGDMFPDMYNDKAYQYCSCYKGLDCMKTIKIIQSYYNKPNESVKIYRAVPSNVEEKQINVDDWVTISREYAIQHGEFHLKGEYEILEKIVKAKQLWTEGNSVFEWGYDI